MEKTVPAPRSRTQRPLQRRIASSNDIEKEVLKHRNKTVTTPVVGRVAQRLFENIMVSGQSPDQDMGSDDTPHHLSIIHAANPNSVRWLDPVHDHPGFYRSVVVDGAKYSVSSFLYPQMYLICVRSETLSWSYLEKTRTLFVQNVISTSPPSR